MPIAAPSCPEALEKRSTIAPRAKWPAASTSPVFTRPRAVGMKPSVVAASGLASSAGPFQVASPASIAPRLVRGQGGGGQVPVFVEPRHDLAVGRIDDAMAEAQPVVKAQCRAFDVKAGPGAQFAGETRVDASRPVRAAQRMAGNEGLGEVGVRLLQPVEVIGDREMLGHVALPGRHRAAIGLDPVRHRALSFHPCGFRGAPRPATDGPCAVRGRLCQPKRQATRAFTRKGRLSSIR